eukprot:scaffold2780_cov206-Prasinococcus_capsulatus_cf.AAC.2
MATPRSTAAHHVRRHWRTPGTLRPSPGEGGRSRVATRGPAALGVRPAARRLQTLTLLCTRSPKTATPTGSAAVRRRSLAARRG